MSYFILIFYAMSKTPRTAPVLHKVQFLNSWRMLVASQ